LITGAPVSPKPQFLLMEICLTVGLLSATMDGPWGVKELKESVFLCAAKVELHVPVHDPPLMGESGWNKQIECAVSLSCRIWGQGHLERWYPNICYLWGWGKDPAVPEDTMKWTETAYQMSYPRTWFVRQMDTRGSYPSKRQSISTIYIHGFVQRLKRYSTHKVERKRARFARVCHHRQFFCKQQ
jgi:hypothetical protein